MHKLESKVLKDQWHLVDDLLGGDISEEIIRYNVSSIRKVLEHPLIQFHPRIDELFSVLDRISPRQSEYNMDVHSRDLKGIEDVGRRYLATKVAPQAITQDMLRGATSQILTYIDQAEDSDRYGKLQEYFKFLDDQFGDVRTCLGPEIVQAEQFAKQALKERSQRTFEDFLKAYDKSPEDSTRYVFDQSKITEDDAKFYAAFPKEASREDLERYYEEDKRNIYTLLIDSLYACATAYEGEISYFREGPYSCHPGARGRVWNAFGQLALSLDDKPSYLKSVAQYAGMLQNLGVYDQKAEGFSWQFKRQLLQSLCSNLEDSYIVEKEGTTQLTQNVFMECYEELPPKYKYFKKTKPDGLSISQEVYQGFPQQEEGKWLEKSDLENYFKQNKIEGLTQDAFFQYYEELLVKEYRKKPMPDGSLISQELYQDFPPEEDGEGLSRQTLMGYFMRNQSKMSVKVKNRVLNQDVLSTLSHSVCEDVLGKSKLLSSSWLFDAAFYQSGDTSDKRPLYHRIYDWLSGSDIPGLFSDIINHSVRYHSQEAIDKDGVLAKLYEEIPEWIVGKCYTEDELRELIEESIIATEGADILQETFKKLDVESLVRPVEDAYVGILKNSDGTSEQPIFCTAADEVFTLKDKLGVDAFFKVLPSHFAQSLEFFKEFLLEIDGELVQECITRKIQLLHIALDTENKEVIDYFFNSGKFKIADFMAMSYKDDTTALMLAAKSGNREIVEELLKAGEDYNKTDKAGNTALIYAVDRGYLDIVKALISAGADYNVIDYKNTLLISAIRNDDTEMSKFLIGYIDINLTGQFGRAALGFAAKYGNREIVEALLKAGAERDKIDDSGRTALMYAAECFHVESDNYNASESDYADTVNALLKAGANCNIIDKEGKTALMYAVENYEIASMLIDAGVDCNKEDNQRKTALIHAAYAGNLDIVAKLIEARVKVDQADMYGWTALMLAAAFGHLNVVTKLIDAGAKVDQANKNRATALMTAAGNGHLSAVEKLIDAGAKVDQSDENGWTALMLAAKSGYLDIVNALIEAGVDCNIIDKQGKTALMYAVENGHAEIVQQLISSQKVDFTTEANGRALIAAIRVRNYEIASMLIKAGVDCNNTDSNGLTALMHAAYAGNLDIVNALIKADAECDKIDNDRRTALMYAVYGNLDIVNALIGAGVDCNNTDRNGHTALMYAVENGHADIVNALIGAGAKCDKIDTDGKTALMHAVENGHTEIVQQLIAQKADIGTKADGRALIAAIRVRKYEIASMLIGAGAECDKIDTDGKTALMYAVENGHAEIVRQLIAQNADIETEANGRALIAAIRVKNYEIASMLIEAGVDCNNTDLEGLTALMRAADAGNLDIVNALIKAGADCNKEDNHGKTALIWAIERNYMEIVSAFINAGAGYDQGDKEVIWLIDKGYTETAHRLIEQRLMKPRLKPSGWRERRIDWEEVDSNGKPVLISALEDGRVDLVDMFIEAGANINQITNGKTALMYAAEIGHVDIVNAIIKKGADCNKEDNHGKTALMFAAENGHVDIVNAIIKKGADCNKEDNHGKTAQMFAAENGHVDIVRQLISQNADFKTRANGRALVDIFIEAGENINQITNGKTALMYAAENGHVDFVNAIINKGADCNKEDNHGKTALMFAAENGHVDIVNVIIKKGAGVKNGGKSGMTALMYAAREGHIDIMNALIDAGANQYDRDNNNKSALMYAAEKGHINIVSKLIGYQAYNFDGADKDGKTALMYAAENGHVDIVNALIDAGAEINSDLLTRALENFQLTSSEQIGKRTEIVKLLIDAGAQVKKGAEGFDLLQRGANIDSSSEGEIKKADEDLKALLIISRACQTGSMKDYKSFLRVNNKDGGYRSGLPLYYAIKNKQLEIALELVRSGYEINIDAHLEESSKRDDSFMNMVRFALEIYEHSELAELVQDYEFKHSNTGLGEADTQFYIDVLKACERGDAIRLQKKIEREYDPKDYSIRVRIKELFIAAYRYIVSLFSSPKQNGVEGVEFHVSQPNPADGLADNRAGPVRPSRGTKVAGGRQPGVRL